MKRGLRYAAAAAAVLVLIVLGVACGGGSTATKTYKLNEAATVGKVTYMIKSVDITKELQRTDAPGRYTAAGMFVVLEVEMKNGSNERINVTGEEVEIVDQNGQAYAFDSRNNNVYLNALGKQSFTKAPVEKGATGTGFMIFDVSADAKEMRAKVKDPNISSRDFVFVDLGA